MPNTPTSIEQPPNCRCLFNATDNREFRDEQHFLKQAGQVLPAEREGLAKKEVLSYGIAKKDQECQGKIRLTNQAKFRVLCLSDDLDLLEQQLNGNLKSLSKARGYTVAAKPQIENSPAMW